MGICSGPQWYVKFVIAWPFSSFKSKGTTQSAVMQTRIGGPISSAYAVFNRTLPNLECYPLSSALKTACVKHRQHVRWTRRLITVNRFFWFSYTYANIIQILLALSQHLDLILFIRKVSSMFVVDVVMITESILYQLLRLRNPD